MTTTDPANLYGAPGADHLYDDEYQAAAAAAGWQYDDGDEVTVEEWTATWPEPLDASYVVYDLAERATCDMAAEHGSEIYVDLAKDERAVELAQALVDHIHGLIRGRYREAHRRVAVHTMRCVDGDFEIRATTKEAQ